MARPLTVTRPRQEDRTGRKVADEAAADDDMPGYDARLEPDAEETRRALRKVDLCILPFIVLCFCFLQFDRTNVGNALTDSLAEDIGVDNSDMNLSQTLFTAGLVVTELPFNLVSRWAGPERFLPVTMFAWGTVTWAQMFVRDAAGLCAARFLVGALEGGYVAGFALYLSGYYVNGELALRLAVFWASNAFAGALGGPLSIGLLSLRGRGGLEGWQWLFLIGPCHVRARRKALGRGSRPVVLPRHVAMTFADWRLYGHVLAGLLSMVMVAPMNTYAPSIIKSLGFTRLQANGLNSVGSICSLMLSVSLAYSSDRSRERGMHIAAGYLVGAAGLLWLALAPSGVGKWTLYGGVVWTQMGMGSAQAISAAWLTAKMEDCKHPVALAAYVMSLQLANFAGNQLFRTQDAPRYRPGLVIAAACAVAAAVVILVWKLLYRVFDGGDGGIGEERGRG
ncbi:hypothetical protein EsDP_00002080 [Epichloe bromicola]|uniref:Major facilitator superfamily transporter n=1 Tax=Epichloe bromicola TaxID=79588 RepID=A0ABQ0CJQ8_9HYPO